MNAWQKLALLVGVLLAVGAVLYPSYHVAIELRAGDAAQSAETWPVLLDDETVVRHLVFLPGPRYHDSDGRVARYAKDETLEVSIHRRAEPDYERMAFEVLVIALATSMVMFMLRSRVLTLRNGGDGSPRAGQTLKT